MTAFILNYSNLTRKIQAKINQIKTISINQQNLKRGNQSTNQAKSNPLRKSLFSVNFKMLMILAIHRKTIR